jgi:GT2 family glycosyltransferase
LVVVKIAVIIPTFNRATVITHTIDSLRAQTHKEWELLIIDDGSTDETRNVVRQYSSENVTYTRTAHRGTPYAWNFGVERSKTDYVFLTADDVILHPNCLKTLADTTRKLPAEKLGAIAPKLIYTRDPTRPTEKEKAVRKYARIDPVTGDVTGSFNIETQKILELPIIHGYSLISRKAFLEVGGFDEKTYKGNFWREETDLWLRMRQKGYKLYYQPEAKIYCQKGTTQGGQWSNVKESLLLYEYYVLRNHRAFLKKFYGNKSYLMLPPFAIRRFLERLSQFLGRGLLFK